MNHSRYNKSGMARPSENKITCWKIQFFVTRKDVGMWKWNIIYDILYRGVYVIFFTLTRDGYTTHYSKSCSFFLFSIFHPSSPTYFFHSEMLTIPVLIWHLRPDTSIHLMHWRTRAATSQEHWVLAFSKLVSNRQELYYIKDWISDSQHKTQRKKR